MQPTQMQQPMQPMQPQQPMGQQPPPKKGMSGCAIAAIIGGVVVLLGIIAVVIVVVLVVNKAKEVVGDMTAAVKEAQNAPGTAQLRAAGCTTAMVLDVNKLAQQTLKAIPGTGNVQIDAGATGLLVQCEAPPAKRMNCMEVAHAYVSAPNHEAEPFTAQVTDMKGDEICSRDFDATGKELGPATRHFNTAGGASSATTP
jgi:Sec-independent protein translocase protein TatA